ncbi:MAG: DUF3334 family protein [Nitrospinota bacterium]|nr:DUF3334 family protein [Nitrospinota bacterium]
MALTKTSTFDFVKLFARAVTETIEDATNSQIYVSRTAMQVEGVQIRGDLGVFMAFSGDYNGIMILNYDAESALEIVGAALRTMSMPEEEIPKYAGSDEVRQSIGELSNQVIGKCRAMVEERYGLTSMTNIPAVVPITVPIALSMVSKEPKAFECVRVQFTTQNHNKFYMEMALEPFRVVPFEAS